MEDIDLKNYTTDGKTQHLSSEEDINTKLINIIGKKFADYRKLWDQANDMDIVTDFPLFLHLDMNQECNYKCPHCIIGHKSLVKEIYGDEVYLNFDHYKKIIDEASEYNCPSLSPQGYNEPFLIKNLHEYISYAHKKGFIDIMLNNNGSAITKKRSQQLLDLGITRLRFSLDATTPETYSKVRVGSIHLDRVKNIFDFLELKEKGNYKLPIVGVSFCKMRANEHELDDFIMEWKDKVDIVSVQRYVPPTPKKQEYREYYSSDQFNLEPVNEFHCVQPFQRIMIRNESITPCCVSFNKDLTLGKLGEMSIYDAWHSEKMNNLRELHKKGEFFKNKTCKDCVEAIYPDI